MATYYVDPVYGSDGNTGTTAGAAWATTAHAASVAVAGDEVRLMATGTETISAQIILAANTRWVGVNVLGTEDGTKYSYIVNPAVTAFSQSGHVQFRNLSFAGNQTDSTLTVNSVTYFVNCDFDGFLYIKAGDGSGHADMNASSCTFSNVTTCANNAINRSGVRWASLCRFNSSVYAINSRGDNTFTLIGSIIDSIGQGYVTYSNGGYAWFVNSVIYGTEIRVYDRAGTGYFFGPFLVNNVITNSPSYGVQWVGDTDALPVDFRGNLFHNNTLGDLGTPPPGVSVSPFNITGQDPLFADTANGDFTPLPGSPLLNAGMGIPGAAIAPNIGAIQNLYASGGGGTGIPNIYAARNLRGGR